ncbi:hypothetical protein [Thiomonas sp.]
MDSEEHFCHVFHGDNPLQQAHQMYHALKTDFSDFEPAFVADEAAKRRYGERALARALAPLAEPRSHVTTVGS